MRLLERDHDLAALNGWLDDVAAGEGRVVLVFGEAGIGKTALLRAFAEGQGRARRVLWGRAFFQGSERPALSRSR